MVIGGAPLRPKKGGTAAVLAVARASLRFMLLFIVFVVVWDLSRSVCLRSRAGRSSIRVPGVRILPPMSSDGVCAMATR